MGIWAGLGKSPFCSKIPTLSGKAGEIATIRAPLRSQYTTITATGTAFDVSLSHSEVRITCWLVTARPLVSPRAFVQDNIFLSHPAIHAPPRSTLPKRPTSCRHARTFFPFPIKRVYSYCTPSTTFSVAHARPTATPTPTPTRTLDRPTRTRDAARGPTPRALQRRNGEKGRELPAENAQGHEGLYVS